MIEYALLRHGEPVMRGNAEEVAAALGVTRDHIYRKAGRRSPDELGYEVVRLTAPKPPKKRKPEAPRAEWSPGTSPTLRMLRKRREEYDGYEPRWEK